MPDNFWKKLKNTSRPILALAPMAGFTNSAFRQVCKQYGADVLYSEMVSAIALFYNQSLKNNETLKLLKFNRAKEKYYVVQLFGANPEHLAVATRIITQQIKPAGIDLNFGCPVLKVTRQGAGSGLMQNLKNSRAALEAVIANTHLPVSIKLRAQAGQVTALEFLKNIQDLPIAAVMIHGRTLKQGFVGAPDWLILKQARQYFSGIILANGGINNLTLAQQVLKESQADGLGLARGVLGRPWLFREIKKNRIIDLKPAAVFKIVLAHAALSQKLMGQGGLIELRKHLAWYMLGLPEAAKLRAQLVRINTFGEIKKILK